MESLTLISCRRSFNRRVAAFTRLSQLASRNPIRYGPHDQDDQNADCDIIGDCHDTPALAGIGEPIMIARATIPTFLCDRITTFFAATQNVCFWHKADIPTRSTNFRFQLPPRDLSRSPSYVGTKWGWQPEIRKISIISCRYSGRVVRPTS